MVLKIFAVALATRWIYGLLLFMTMGDPGLESLDSTTYLADAHQLALAIDSGTLHGAQWLGSSTITMPLFGWLIGLHALFFGKWTALAFVITQGALDAGTCILIYGIAQTFDPRIARPAGIAAALNPTQIVLSALVYADTTFLFFVALFFYAAARWLHTPIWRWAVLAGIGIGAAAMTRILAAPWAVFLVLFLLLVAIVRGSVTRWLVLQLALTSTIIGLFIAPVLWRNVSEYGAWSLTSQSGIHLSYWIVPLVKEARDGTPWTGGYEEMQAEVNRRFPLASANPFERSRRYEIVGREKLAELGPAAITKAWAFGAAINLAAPAAAISPIVANLPRTGYYATPGTSLPNKAFNFMFHSDNAIYAWAILLGGVGLAAMRLVQLFGLFTLVRQSNNLPMLTLLLFWVVYILAANGPIASPKYRLPMEPVFMLLAGAGFHRLGLRLPKNTVTERLS